MLRFVKFFIVVAFVTLFFRPFADAQTLFQPELPQIPECKIKPLPNSPVWSGTCSSANFHIEYRGEPAPTWYKGWDRSGKKVWQIMREIIGKTIEYNRADYAGMDILTPVYDVKKSTMVKLVPKGVCQFSFANPRLPHNIKVRPNSSGRYPVHRCFKFEEWLGPPALTLHTVDFFPIDQNFRWERDADETARLAAVYVWLAGGH